MDKLLKAYPVMEPVKREEVSDSEDFLYQVKWDGVRMLAGVSGENVTLLNKRGHFRTIQYPELQTLPNLIAADSAILDGEIVVLKEGKPSFPTVMQRDLAGSLSAIQMLTRALPIAYMVFDLLYLNGKDLRSQTLSERITLLADLFSDQDYLYQVQRFPQGSSLFAAVKEANLEGIVAKRKDSFYLPGKQHKDWYKIKVLRSQKCLVGGYTLRGRQVNSLLLGVWREDKLLYAGKAANGLNTAHLQMLTAEFPRLAVQHSPFANPTPKEAHYIEPHLAVLVEFMEWTDSLQLRFPVIKSFITASASDCSV